MSTPEKVKCNFPGCDKMLPLPPWPIIKGSIRCLDHVVVDSVTRQIVEVLQNSKVN